MRIRSLSGVAAAGLVLLFLTGCAPARIDGRLDLRVATDGGSYNPGDTCTPSPQYSGAALGSTVYLLDSHTLEMLRLTTVEESHFVNGDCLVALDFPNLEKRDYMLRIIGTDDRTVPAAEFNGAVLHYN